MPVRQQLRSLGALRPAGLPTADEPRPLGVGARVVGTAPAGPELPQHENPGLVRTNAWRSAGRLALWSLVWALEFAAVLMFPTN